MRILKIFGILIVSSVSFMIPSWIITGFSFMWVNMCWLRLFVSLLYVYVHHIPPFQRRISLFRSHDSLRLMLCVSKVPSHNFSAYLSTGWESPSKIMCTIRLCELQANSMWSSQTILKSILPQTTFDSWTFFVCRAKLVPTLLKKKNDSFIVTVITVVTEWFLAKNERNVCITKYEMDFFKKSTFMWILWF